MRYLNEIKVGVVVLVGLLVIFFGYFWLRGVGLGADTYYVRLNGAANIAQGNDVRLQGVKIGQIEEVGFDAQTQQPILKLAVRRSKPPFKLLRSYVYSVQSAGIVGENYVDIRGKYDPIAPVYLPNTEGEFIPGKAAGGVLAIADSAQDIVRDFQGTLKKLNVTIDRVNKGVLNYGNQAKLASALDGVARLTQNASQSFGREGVRIGFGSPAAQRDLNRTLANAQVASQNAAQAARNIELTTRNFGGVPGEVRGLVSDFRGTLNANRGQLSGLVANLNRTSNNVAGVTESLDFALRQGGFRENAQLAFQSLRRTAENIEVATGGLRKLASDEGTQTDLRQTLTALRESTQALRDTTQTIRNTLVDDNNKSQIGGALTSLSETAKNLASVTAGLNRIVGDADLQNNVKGATANLNATLAATSAAAERVNALLGGRRPRRGVDASGAPAAGGPNSDANRGNIGAPSAFPSGINFTFRRYLNVPNLGGPRDVSGRNYGDIDFNAEFGGGPFRLGLANIGDGDDLTLQSGQFFGQNAAIRYGLYRSKLGVGLELRRGRFSLEGNAWNANDRSYNVYGGLQITKNLQIIAGRENLRGDGTNSVGVRLSQ
ncbi:MAG TPA: MlaD family protein [Abditibacterium sp.]|jgi:ABC-type transporter Mla subunit MlaD